MSGAGNIVPRLSPELWLEIFSYLVPSGAPTTMATLSSKIELRPHVLEYRRTLWAACQVSRQVGACARNRLYQAVHIYTYKELLYLFRTLRMFPEMQPLVKSFYWVGMSHRSDEEKIKHYGLMSSFAAVFASLPPPSTEADVLLHNFIDPDNFQRVHAWRLLAAVLAMVSEITTLFLTFGRLMFGSKDRQWVFDTELAEGDPAEMLGVFLRPRRTWEQGIFEYKAIMEVVENRKRHTLTTAGHPLLPNLQVLILDPIGFQTQLPKCYMLVTAYIALICPQLRYIQTKHGVYGSLQRELRSTSMRHLLIRRQQRTIYHLTSIQRSYPNLTSLRIVTSEDEESSISNSTPSSLRSLTKFKLLQYLSITTPHNLTWKGLRIRPPMSRFLRQMESLQHLRVDFIRLVGRNDPGRLFHMASFLPLSIQSLHLLDYWAVSATSTSHATYPTFPDNMSATAFKQMVLENLLENSGLTGLRSLREVKLSSGEYAEDSGGGNGARQSLNDLICRFSQAGIRLTVTGLEEARNEEVAWWLNLD